MKKQASLQIIRSYAFFIIMAVCLLLEPKYVGLAAHSQKTYTLAPSSRFMTKQIDPDQVESELLTTLKIPDNKVYRSTAADGIKVKITQYKNDRDEAVPFLRVGKFMVIQETFFNRLGKRVQNYPYNIVLNSKSFDRAFDYHHTYSWSGYTIGVLAAMIANEDTIRGAAFFDIGAGATGIFAVAAHMLGAAEIVVIEKDSKQIAPLKGNLARNGVQSYALHESPIQELDPIVTRRPVVFALNLPGYGTRTAKDDESDALAKALAVIQIPTLAFLSGGAIAGSESAVETEVERIMRGHNHDSISKLSVQKEMGSDDFTNIHSYTTLIVTFRNEDITSGRLGSSLGELKVFSSSDGISFDQLFQDLKKRDQIPQDLPNSALIPHAAEEGDLPTQLEQATNAELGHFLRDLMTRKHPIMESMRSFSDSYPYSDTDLLVGFADLLAGELGGFDHHISSFLQKMEVMRRWKREKAQGQQVSDLFDELVDQAPRYQAFFREFTQRWVSREKLLAYIRKEGPASIIAGEAGEDGVPLSALETAFNVLNIPTVKDIIQEKLCVRFPRTEISPWEHFEHLHRYGKTAGTKGPFVYYPFGGFDPHTPFNVVEEATDVVAMGGESFGSTDDIVAFCKNADPYDKGGGYFKYDLKNELQDMMKENGMSGLGALAVARIISFLKGRVERITYFEIQNDGGLRYLDKDEIRSKENQKNAVIEFKVKNSKTGQEITKRYWYVQHDVFNGLFPKYFLKQLGLDPDQYREAMYKHGYIDEKGITLAKIEEGIKRFDVGLSTEPELKKHIFEIFYGGYLDNLRFTRFTERIKFQTMLIKAANHMWDYSEEEVGYGYNMSGYLKLLRNKTLAAAIRNKAVTLSDNRTVDNSTYTEDYLPHSIWKYPPKTIPLKYGEFFGYSSDGEYIYYGPSEWLMDDKNGSVRSMVEEEKEVLEASL